ncbi:ribonuclease E/G [Gracilibacillus alcaliphilus]|uniref:ribonuclease E/G n=1 Tax=Gracilibacillus alcaliphilus TaxID=1401441 RepID=UPI00195BC491|nr:ribonuclease E/G [Gracilibacillus alcaliphilus]MBM7678563.1 ribonuclease G [Gracilibacillus alcaliphilus]
MKLHFMTTLSEKIGLLLNQGQCHDIFIERESQKASHGSIYLAKVRNVDDSIEAAFIDIGTDKVAFLPKRMVPSIAKHDRLSSYLPEGSRLIVQVVKEAYQEKGPQVTADISLAGQYLIYLPLSRRITGSRKLSDQVISQWQQQFASRLQATEGLILRTAITEAEETAVLAEFDHLRRQWQAHVSRAEQQKAPYLLFHAQLVPYQMLQQYQHLSFDDITFDDSKTCAVMKQLYPQRAGEMRVSRQTMRFGGKHVDQWLSEAIQPEVTKPDGITLTVEQTAALTVIDVDSHKFKSRQNKQITAMTINQKAVDYCVAEIRKRNLSGIIMIDFLKVTPKEEKILIQQMNEALQADYMQTKVYGFTALGLLEMTRKRERESLQQLLTEHASSCSLQLSSVSTAYRLQRELAELGLQTEALVLALRQEVYQALMQQDNQFTSIIYFYIDDTIDDYQIIRSGSQELIDDFIEKNPATAVDKLL